MILVPVLAACAGAAFLALAAQAQHSAVAGAASGRARLEAAAVLSLVRRPLWLAGAVLTVVGAACALFALSRAPLTLVQPIGVLSVPIALLITCRLQRRPAAPPELAAVLATVGGVAVFVLCTAQPGPATIPPVIALGRGAALLLPLVAVLAALGLRGPRRWRAVAWTAAAAALYGLGTALVKGLFLRWHAYGDALLHHPDAWLLGAGALAAFLIGGWCVQHAFHAGSAHLVLAGLTVIDPLVAVLLGMTALGEIPPTGWRLAGALVAAAVAAGAIGYLSGRDGVPCRARGRPAPVPQRPSRRTVSSGT